MGAERYDRLCLVFSGFAAFAILLQAFGPLLPIASSKVVERNATLAFALSLSPNALCLSNHNTSSQFPDKPARHSNDCALCYSLHLIGPALLPVAIVAILKLELIGYAGFFNVDSQITTLARATTYPRAPPIFC